MWSENLVTEPKSFRESNASNPNAMSCVVLELYFVKFEKLCCLTVKEFKIFPGGPIVLFLIEYEYI